MTHRLNFTDKTFDRVNLKRRVITFDLIDSFQSITYEIEGNDEEVVLIYYRLKTEVGSKVMTYRLNITDKTIDSGKLKTLSHGFGSGRQFYAHTL